MKRSFVLILTIALTVILIAPVRAGSILQSAHHDFYIEPGASSFQEYIGLNFDSFDDQGQTRILDAVSISYSINAEAHVTVENDMDYLMDTVSVTSTVHLDIDNFGQASHVDMYSEEGGIGLDQTDYITGSGPDFYDFGILTIDGQGYYDTTSDFSIFTGSGPLQLVFDGSANYSLGGMWSPIFIVSDLAASMNVSLTYEYSVVPEPSTVLLFGMATMVLKRRK